MPPPHCRAAFSDISSHEPALYPWIRLALAVVGGLMTMAVLTLLAIAIDAPITAGIAHIGRVGGPLAQGAVGVAIIGGAFLFARWSMRRNERRQIAETGILDVEAPRDTRRTLRRILLVTSPLWAVVAVLLVMSVIVTVTGR